MGYNFQLVNIITIIFMVTCMQCQLDPIVLVPGFSGTRLQARRKIKQENTTLYDFFLQRVCGIRNNWFTAWVSIWKLTNVCIQYTVEMLSLVYENEDYLRGKNNKDYLFRIHKNEDKTGGVNSILRFTRIPVESASMFDVLINALLEKEYEVHKNLFGAPFDFRHIPDAKLMMYLKNMIERAYESGDQKPVTLIGFSIGSMLILYFLNDPIIDEEWRNKYIKKYISLGAPFQGTIEIFRTMITGEAFYMPFVNKKEMRRLERTLETSMFLIPTEKMMDGLPAENRTLVYTKFKNYSIYDLEDLFNDISFDNGYKRHLAMRKYVQPDINPHVDTVCIHGTGMPSVRYVDYRDVNFPVDTPKYIMGDGDGTVGYPSLSHCKNWKQSLADQGKTLTYKTFAGLNHVMSLSSKPAVEYIIQSIFYNITSIL